MFGDNSGPARSASVPTRTEASENNRTSQESASAASEEGIILSNMLRQIMPMLSENNGAESNTPSTGGTNSDETQVMRPF